MRNLKKRKERDLGVIEAMISSIKDNRRVRGQQKTMRDRADDYSYENSPPLEFKDSMTAEEHARHQAEWRMRKRRSNLKLGLVLTAFLLIIAYGVYWLSN